MTEQGGMKSVDFWHSEEARQEEREDADRVMQDEMERQLGEAMKRQKNEAEAAAQQDQAAAGMELAGRQMREALMLDGNKPDVEEKRVATKRMYETWAVEWMRAEMMLAVFDDVEQMHDALEVAEKRLAESGETQTEGQQLKVGAGSKDGTQRALEMTWRIKQMHGVLEEAEAQLSAHNDGTGTQTEGQQREATADTGGTVTQTEGQQRNAAIDDGGTVTQTEGQQRDAAIDDGGHCDANREATAGGCC